MVLQPGQGVHRTDEGGLKLHERHFGGVCGYDGQRGRFVVYGYGLEGHVEAC